ncbi:PREDICTED: uncharacterized protein LOC108493337 isoform X2 [Lepidothrix coronata]|uniref:Uncharacterized protein LOC108493337 isoform X2 n=1 Tax=Lepidothrix coronata TaxID=321398 RepID=A0A6J0GJH7_9PASS|nr:PREDICTED: uncharacterized protein LOC108493337 isoform X2 [Lepidothrix coronata]
MSTLKYRREKKETHINFLHQNPRWRMRGCFHTAPCPLSITGCCRTCSQVLIYSTFLSLPAANEKYVSLPPFHFIFAFESQWHQRRCIWS